MPTQTSPQDLRGTIKHLNETLKEEYPKLSLMDRFRLFLLPLKNAPRNQYKTAENGIILDTRDDYVKKILTVQRHYLKYAASAFGSFLKIRSSYKPGCPFGPYQYRISNNKFGDRSIKNACKILGIKKNQIHFINRKSQHLLPICYYVVDDVKKEVVFVLRGTLSFDDLATDLHYKPVPFMNGFAHEGIVKASQKLLTLIEKDTILKRIPQDYRVVLTGHSLGGGVATIMGILMKESLNDKVRVMAYSPVPTVSRDIIDSTRSMVSSLVLGFDPVCSYAERSIFEYVERTYGLEHSETPRMQLYPAGTVYHFLNHEISPSESSEIKRLIYYHDWVLKVQDNLFFDTFTPSAAELFIYHNVGIMYKILDEHLLHEDNDTQL